MKALAIATFATATFAAAMHAWAQATPAAYVAEYDVRYGSLSVGSSRSELSAGPQPGRYQFETRSTASGFARIIAGGTLLQRSSFELDGAAMRPLSYRFDDGTTDTDHDVALEFDWRAGRVRGTAEDARVDVATEPGLQDAASIQALVSLRLQAGLAPGTIAMIEKDRIKRYRYTELRRERIKTALGELETVVYRSSREGSTRETISWFAPSLGYVLVRAEQRRDGDRTFHTYIRRHQTAG
jgi:hypothetical protein